MKPVNYRRNFLLNTADGVSYFTGMILLSPETIMPLLLHKLGASAFLISLIPVLRNVGIYFPSIFIARYLQFQRKQKYYILKVGVLQRIPYLFAGLFCLFAAEHHPRAASLFILAMIFTESIGSGLNIPSFFYLTGKTIPVDKRGRLFATRNLISYFLGFLGGGLISWMLGRYPFPQNFGYLILLGFGLLIISIPVLALIREPDATINNELPLNTRQFYQKVQSILKTDRDLVNYITGRVFFTIAFASYSYFAVYLVRQYQLPESEAGIFTLVIAGTYVLANPVLALISDRQGHLFNHFIGSGALILANLIAIFSPWYGLSLVSIALGGLVACITTVSCFSLPMEFGDEHDIPVYVGLTGLFIGAASLVIIGFGIIARRFGFVPLFWICLICAGISVFFFAHTKEPRHRRGRAIRDIH